MGRFLGERIPDYNPFWEEEYKDKPDWYKWYHVGYDDGFAVGKDNKEGFEKLEQENEALRTLMITNYRVTLDEMRKQAKEQLEQ